MGYVLLVISVVVNLVLMVVLQNHRKTVKETVKQVERINRDTSQMKLKNYSSLNDYDELMTQMNQLIEKHNQTKIYYTQAADQNKRMISSISHDFRTPLTSMLGYIQLLQETQSEAKKEHYLSIIEERTKSLTDLVNEFHLLSLLDSENYERHSETVNPIIQVQERVALYYNDLETVFSEVVIDLEEQPLNIQTSMVDFNRIIDNIIRNAMMHGINSFRLTKQVEQDTLQFVFSNEVDAPHTIQVDQLFERLYKADRSRTTRSTGLGLAIAKELSEKLGYGLEVELKDSMIHFKLTIPIK